MEISLFFLMQAVYHEIRKSTNRIFRLFSLKAVFRQKTRDSECAVPWPVTDRRKGSYNTRFSDSSYLSPVGALHRSVQVGHKFPLDSPFDFNESTGGVDDPDELVHGLALVIEAQFFPHGQVVADLCIVSFLMKLQLGDALH